MRFNLSLLISFLCLKMIESGVTKNGRNIDPFVPGDMPVNHTLILNALSIATDTNIDVYAPNAPGNYPVFYFITGLAGLIPSFGYTNVLTRIASHGIVALGIWKVDNPIDSFNATWFDETVNFVEKRLERYLHNEGFDSEMHVDYTNSFIAGHSSGAHVPVAQFQAHCLNFQGLILLDPVDGGVDLQSMTPFFVITPGELVNFTVPTLEIVAGYDTIPSNTSGYACAPEEYTGKRFYNAMRGPTWYVNATAYGHGDFLDPSFEILLEITQFCVTNPETPKEEYINFIAGEIVAFIKGVLDPVANCDLFRYLETNGILGIETLNEYNANGWERCTDLECINLLQ